MAAAFLGALAGTIADEYDPSALKGAHLSFSSRFPGTPESARRESFFGLVFERAAAMLHDEDAFLVAKRGWIASLTQAPRENATAEELKEFRKSSPEWHRELFRKFCSSAFDRLIDKLHTAGETKFFLVLDGCCALGTGYQDEGGPLRHSSLIAFQRILKAAEHITTPVSFWFLLIDTCPSPVMLRPPSPPTSSSRFTRDLQPLPPFVYMDFNQMSDHFRKDKASASLEIENLKYLGRPVCHGRVNAFMGSCADILHPS